MQPFNFAKKPMTSVPDLSGIKGFSQGGQVESRLAHNQEIADSNSAPATNFVQVVEPTEPVEMKITTTDNPEGTTYVTGVAGYFSPQASIIRVGENVAVKVVVQTEIRDEAILEELKNAAQAWVTEIEKTMRQREQEKQAGDMDRDPTPRTITPDQPDRTYS